MTLDQIANWAQILEAVILSLSIVFIGAEARQTLQHSRTQFGHGLTDRLYAVSYTHLTLPTKA